MAKTITLSEDVLDVLQRSTITATTLALPHQLDRKLYEKVMKVIKASGGIWHKGAGTHVFASDPRLALGLALETGSIENQQQAFQEFYTPEWLAHDTAEEVGFGDRVLEPSAGTGRLAKAAAVRTDEPVVCIDIQAKNCDLLRQDERLIVVQADFLKVPASVFRPFDQILMNPPFADNQEYDHIRHALLFLRTGGVLTSILSPGFTYRDDAATRRFNDLLKCQTWHAWDKLPSGTFSESGTNVETVRLMIRK